MKAANGKTLLIFDPTDEETPLGLISEALQGAWGNLANGADSQVLQMPVLPPETAGLNRKGTFTLAADGSLSGDVSEVFLGDEATYERSFLKENDSIGRAADAVTRRLHPEPFRTYNIDRNINYTNICNVYCTFCAFMREEKDDDSYVLTPDQVGAKIKELVARIVAALVDSPAAAE